MSTSTAELLNPSPHDLSTFQGRMRHYAKLANHRRDLEADLKSVKEQMAGMEQSLIEEMSLNGIENMRVEGLVIYPTVETHVSKKSDESGATIEVLCETLRQCGLGYMVKDGYSASSLKSKIREWRSEGIEIPPALAGLLNCVDIVTLTTRRV
jgi:hypothetical protein